MEGSFFHAFINYFLYPFVAFSFQNLTLQYVKMLFLLLLSLLPGKYTDSSEKKNSQQLFLIPFAFQEHAYLYQILLRLLLFKAAKLQKDHSFVCSQATTPICEDLSIPLTL